ncbi:MAG TPA: hypothetical protein VFB45_12935 [Pseudolabrys sp.]|nr:hypothetical protein [Pseudolabrys sp.]
MQRSITLALILALATCGPALAKKRHHARIVRSQPQIACTMNGCIPVPPGCWQEPGKTWTDEPTGMDVIVCPPGVQPYR